MNLVVFDKANGNIILQRFNETEIQECGSLLVDVPADKTLVGIDVATNEPIYEDKPLSIEDRLALLEASQDDQDSAISDLAEILGGE